MSERKPAASPRGSFPGGKPTPPKPFSGVPSSRNPASVSSAEGWFSHEGIFLLAGFILVVVGVLGLPTVNFPFGNGNFLGVASGFPPPLWLGLACLFWAFRFLPPVEKSPEPGRGWVYGCLFFLYLVCFAMRVYNPEVPSQSLNDDGLGYGDDLRKIVDFHFFRMFTAVGIKTAIFDAVCAPLEIIFPRATSIWALRVGGAIVDLGTLWGLYLLGRVLRGRRLGLILAALWASCKFAIIFVYFEYGWGVHLLTCAWALVFFFRLIQKPVFRRYVYFGAAIGFGGYDWYTFRPWSPALFGALLVWILFNFKEKPKGLSAWFLVTGGMTSWVFLFFYKNNFLPENHPLVVFFISPQGLWFTVAALLAAYLKTGFSVSKNEACFHFFGWATAVWVALLLTLPSLLDPEYSSHLAVVSVMNEGTKTLLLAGGGPVHTFYLNLIYFFQLIFAQPLNQGALWYPMARDSSLDSLFTVGMVTGLVLFIARPSWKKGFLLALIPVGLSPFLFSVATYLGRASGALLLLLVIGGWGLDYFWELLRRALPRPFFQRILLFLLLIFGVWNVAWSFTLAQRWIDMKTYNALVGEAIAREAKNSRVVVDLAGLGKLPSDLTLLCDQKEVFTFQGSNPVIWRKGEEGKSIVLLTSKNNDLLFQRVKKEFPSAFREVFPGRQSFMAKFVISSKDLSEKPGKLFYRQTAEGDFWRRRFYYQWLGLAHGLIWKEDRVTSLKAEWPSSLIYGMSCQAEGEFDAPVEGDYFFETGPTGDCLLLKIDNHRIFRLGEINGVSQGGKVRLHLGKGVHSVIFSVYFQNGLNFPEVFVTLPGGGPRGSLGGGKKDG